MRGVSLLAPYLVKIGEVESSEKALLRVCFQQDTYIDKKSLLQFFRDRIELDISLDDDAKAMVLITIPQRQLGLMPNDLNSSLAHLMKNI